jgi:hypothetical protein
VLAPIGVRLLTIVFDRSSDAIRHKASRMRLCVARRLEIDGTDLTQAQLERLRQTNEAMLCPSCSRRMVAIPSTGLCGICHKDALLRSHAATLAELEKQREINRAKQRVSRLRRELGIKAPRSRRRKG